MSLIDVNSLSPEELKNLKMKMMNTELQGLRNVLDYLMDGNKECFAPLIWIKSNYKDWAEMIKWLKDNDLRGQKLLDFFANQSFDGGGYHMGCSYILNKLDGLKHRKEIIKADRLS